MSELMKAQYLVLGELRRIDEKIARIQLDIERIPEEKTKLTSTLSSHKQTYDKAKNLVTEAEKKLRKAELDLKEKDDKLSKADDRMRELKTNEEFQAAMKENEGQKQEKAKIEELIVATMAEVDSHKKALQEVEKEFKAREAAVNKDLTVLEEEAAKISKSLEEMITKRSQAASGLSHEVGNLYRRLASKMGVAVVSAEHGMCMGCNMKIRPQLYNEILGFKAVHPCPSCGRIVIIPSPDNSAEQEAAAK